MCVMFQLDGRQWLSLRVYSYVLVSREVQIVL